MFNLVDPVNKIQNEGTFNSNSLYVHMFYRHQKCSDANDCMMPDVNHSNANRFYAYKIHITY